MSQQFAQIDGRPVLIVSPDIREQLAAVAMPLFQAGLATDRIAAELADRWEWRGIHESHVYNAIAWWRANWGGPAS